jgi:hypothetical protein
MDDVFLVMIRERIKLLRSDCSLYLWKRVRVLDLTEPSLAGWLGEYECGKEYAEGEDKVDSCCIAGDKQIGRREGRQYV